MLIFGEFRTGEARKIGWISIAKGQAMQVSLKVLSGTHEGKLIQIKDEKFLKLIYDALRAGFMKDSTYNDTFLGTPQGGIHSPILFNIYIIN